MHHYEPHKNVHSVHYPDVFEEGATKTNINVLRSAVFVQRKFDLSFKVKE